AVGDAAADAAGVVRQVAVGDRQPAGVVDAAAAGGSAVVGQGTVADRERAGVVDAATAVAGGGARQGAVGEGQRAIVENAAAFVGVGVLAVGECEVGEGGLHAAIHLEDPAVGVAVHRDPRGAPSIVIVAVVAGRLSCSCVPPG